MRPDCLRPQLPLPRPQRVGLLLAVLAALSATACNRADDGSSGASARETAPAASTAGSATSGPAGSAPPDATEADASITMRYDCEQGHSVAIAGDEARVTLADGRRVAIPRVADSAPPRFAGEALSFEVNATGAVLGQDEVGGFDCTAN